jgi:Protein of unknown function (DUF3305)
MSDALEQISVGVAVERRRPKSPWSTEQLWRPASVFVGRPSAQAWTVIDSSAEVTTFYAGESRIELFRTETVNYLSNLAMRPPLLWIILRSIPREPGMELQGVTADPAEGEALTGSGTDIVETVPMPASIRERLRAFIAEHHIDRPMYKRQRDRAERS